MATASPRSPLSVLHDERRRRRRRGRELPDVTFVIDDAGGAAAHYARKLADHLPVHRVLFDASAGGRRSGRATLHEQMSKLRFALELNDTPGLVHLSAPHLARSLLPLAPRAVVTVGDPAEVLEATGSAEPSQRHWGARRGLRRTRLALSRAAGIVTLAEASAHELARGLRIPSSRVVVIPPGVDDRWFHPHPRRLLDDPYVLFAAHERPGCDLVPLLHAFAALKREPGFANLKLVRTGLAGAAPEPFRARTRRTLDRLGLTRDVVVLGVASEEAMAGWYSGAECFLLMCAEAGYGAALEAMASGCALLAVDAGLLPELAGPAAVLVRPDDADALARVLRRLLEQPDTRRMLEDSGRRWARRFTWHQAAAQTLDVYRELAAAARPQAQ